MNIYFDLSLRGIRFQILDKMSLLTKTIFLPYEIMLYIRRMQMENTIAKNIIYYAYNRTKQHEVAKALGYSTKQLTRICKVPFLIVPINNFSEN